MTQALSDGSYVVPDAEIDPSVLMGNKTGQLPPQELVDQYTQPPSTEPQFTENGEVIAPAAPAPKPLTLAERAKSMGGGPAPQAPSAGPASRAESGNLGASPLGGASGGAAPGATPPGSGGGGPAKMPENYGYTPSQIKQHDLQYDYLQKSGGLDKQQAAIQQQLEERKARVLAQAVQQQQQLEAQAQAREKERQLWVNSAMARHEQEADALAREKIDPNNWFASKDTGGKIFAVIGMALGGFSDVINATPHAGPSGMGAVGQAMLGRSKDFATWMDRMIDQDIQVQKMNHDNAVQAFGVKRGLFSDRMNVFQNERMAEASAKASAWQLVGQQVQSLSQSSNSEAAKVYGEKLALTADTNAENYKLQVGAQAEQAWLQHLKQQQAVAAAEQARIRARLEKRADMDYELAAKGGFPQGELVHLPNGYPAIRTADGTIVPISKPEEGKTDKTQVPIYGPNGKTIYHAGNPEGANKLNGILHEKEVYKKAVLGMKSAAAMPGPYVGEKKKLYDMYATSAQGAYKNMYGLGAYDLGVERLTKLVIPGHWYGVGWQSKGDASMLDSQLKVADEIGEDAMSHYLPDYNAPQQAPPGQPGAGLQLTPNP